MTGVIPQRTPYQGLVQIFAFNRPFYLRAIAAIAVTLLTSLYLPPMLRTLLLLGMAAATFWACSSLLVSHYVYDRSGFYSLAWLPVCLSRAPRRWLNLHAGLDEISPTLQSIFPASEGRTLDIYDPLKMTEPSIRRARLLAGAPFVSHAPQHLPAANADFDTAFLVFVAHEFRSHADRVHLFREAARALRIQGDLVLGEHLRDTANFLAFGPGAFHFFSKRAWLRAAHAADLTLRLHTTVTPFVHVFVFLKQP